MSDRKIKRIPKAETEMQAEEIRRTEIAMLKLLAKKYPFEAQKFANTVKSNFSLTKSFV